jgi:hypothetical protein
MKTSITDDYIWTFSLFSFKLFIFSKEISVDFSLNYPTACEAKNETFYTIFWKKIKK